MTAPSAPIATPTRRSSWRWPTSPGTARTSSTPTRAWIAWSWITAPADHRAGRSGDRPALPRRRQAGRLERRRHPRPDRRQQRSNNVLVYPGLGNGQFGPAVNGGHGFFTGTDPIGIAVADLNAAARPGRGQRGSNDVSVLLGQGTGSSWTMVPARGSRPTPGRWPWRWGTCSATASSTSPWPTSRPTTSRSSPVSAAGSSSECRNVR